MNNEYEIIYIPDEGRAILNNKTKKIYHNEFEIIEEQGKEIERLNNIIKTYSGYLDTVEYNMKMGDKMVEYELARAVITNAKKKFEELKGSDK